MDTCKDCNSSCGNVDWVSQSQAELFSDIKEQELELKMSGGFSSYHRQVP